MIDKSHCKLRIEDAEEEEDEFLDFYRFLTSLISLFPFLWHPSELCVDDLIDCRQVPFRFAFRSPFPTSATGYGGGPPGGAGRVGGARG